MLVPRPAVAFVRSLLRRSGLEVHRRSAHRRLTTEAFFAQQQLLAGAPVATILDVGANTGQTARRYLELFPDARIHSFEPFPDAHRELAALAATAPRLRAHRLAVADAAGVRTLHTNRYSPTNSLLPNAPEAAELVGNPDLIEAMGTVEVEATTLDAFCAEQQLRAIDVLKMDTQGSELMILKGGERLLRERRIRLVYSEVLFGRLYEGQAELADLCLHLRDRGYRLFGLYELAHAANGRLGWADAIFLPE